MMIEMIKARIPFISLAKMYLDSDKPLLPMILAVCEVMDNPPNAVKKQINGSIVFIASDDFVI